MLEIMLFYIFMYADCKLLFRVAMGQDRFVDPADKKWVQSSPWGRDDSLAIHDGIHKC